MSAPQMTTDAILGTCFDAAVGEVRDLFSKISPEDATPAEIVAILAILRGVHARVAVPAPPVSLQLVRPKGRR